MRADARGAAGPAARRAALIAAAALILLLPGARASAGLSEALFKQAGMDEIVELSGTLGGGGVGQIVEAALSGELRVDRETISRWMHELVAALREGLIGTLKALAAPALASVLMRMLSPNRAGGEALALLCRLSCAVVLMRRYLESLAVARAALSATVEMVNAAGPALISILTLTGSTSGAALLSPSAALCAGLIENALRDVMLPLCGAAAALAAAADLSGHFRLDRLFALVRRCVVWGVGLLTAGFAGMLALQGALALGQEGLTASAVRRAIRAAIPGVGGGASGSASALIESALAVRGAAGAVGMLALLGVAAAPVAKLAVSALSLSLAEVVLEPTADAGITAVVGRFRDVEKLLLAVCAAGALLGVVLLGGCTRLSTF